MNYLESISGKNLVELKELISINIAELSTQLINVADSKDSVEKFLIKIRKIDKYNLLSKHLFLDVSVDLKEIILQFFRTVSMNGRIKELSNTDLYEILTSISLLENDAWDSWAQVSSNRIKKNQNVDVEQLLCEYMFSNKYSEYINTYDQLSVELRNNLASDYLLIYYLLTDEKEKFNRLMKEIKNEKKYSYEHTFKNIVENKMQSDMDNMLSYYVMGLVPYEEYLFPLVQNRIRERKI